MIFIFLHQFPIHHTGSITMNASDFDFLLDTLRASMAKMAATDLSASVRRMAQLLATDLSPSVRRMAQFLAVGERNIVLKELQEFLHAAQYESLLSIPLETSWITRAQAAFYLEFFDILRPTLTPVGLLSAATTGASSPPPTTVPNHASALPPLPPSTTASAPTRMPIAVKYTKREREQLRENVKKQGSARPRKYCWCRGKGSERMTGCDGCQEWFHWSCIQKEMGEEKLEVAMVFGSEMWYCKDCETGLLTGQRKSIHT